MERSLVKRTPHTHPCASHRRAYHRARTEHRVNAQRRVKGTCGNVSQNGAGGRSGFGVGQEVILVWKRVELAPARSSPVHELRATDLRVVLRNHFSPRALHCPVQARNGVPGLRAQVPRHCSAALAHAVPSSRALWWPRKECERRNSAARGDSRRAVQQVALAVWTVKSRDGRDAHISAHIHATRRRLPQLRAFAPAPPEGGAAGRRMEAAKASSLARGPGAQSRPAASGSDPNKYV